MGFGVYTAAAVLFVGALVTTFFGGAAAQAMDPAILYGAGALVVVAFALGWGFPVTPETLHRSMDRALGLPDHTITAGERAGRDDEWSALQKADTLERLRTANWSRAWPLRRLPFTNLAAFAGLCFALIISMRAAAYVPPQPPVPTNLAAAATAAAFAEVFDDWEQAAKEFDDPGLARFLEETAPLREALESGQLSERETLLTLSKLEDALEQRREQLGVESMEAAAEPMADAFSDMQMNALAAAMRKSDFAAAKAQAEKQAEKLSQPGAESPESAAQESAQQKMSRAADALEKAGEKNAAAAMKQAQQAGEKKDAAQMSQAMQKLGQCMGREATRKEASQRIGSQLAQVKMGKQCLGDKDGLGSALGLLPKLCQKPGGGGAGAESDPNREKDPTELDASRTAETVSGVAGEGDSEKETLASDTPGPETTRSGRGADFSEYQKLSETAIADENLPIAYRETIRKYFEAIRPRSD